MIDFIVSSAVVIAKANKFDPVWSLVTVFFFYMIFEAIEILFEKLLFGGRFPHWLDLPFMLGWFAYSGLVVWCCARGQL